MEVLAALLLFVALPLAAIALGPWLDAALAVLTGSKRDLLTDGNLCRKGPLTKDDYYWDPGRYGPAGPLDRPAR